MIIYIGADHRGFELKESLKKFLIADGHEVVDLGNEKYDENDDYPDFSSKVAQMVADKTQINADKEVRGIVICRSGVGVDIVANKFKGVRSALATTVEQAHLSRSDDDTNVLALASGVISEAEAREIAATWLHVPFSNSEKDNRRINKIKAIENH